MNTLTKLLGSMVLAAGAMGVSKVMAAAPAGTAVFQRTENTQSIELSNIEEEGVPVAVETVAPAGAKAVVQSPIKVPVAPSTAKMAKKKKSSTDGADDEEVAEGEEPETRQGRADASRSSDKDRVENVGMTTANFGGGFTGSTGGTGTSGVTTGTSNVTTGAPSNGSTTNSAGTAAGTSNGAGTGATTGTGTSAGAGASSGTSGGTGSVPSVPSGPVTASTLDSKLVQYRDQMLLDVVNAQVTNPAITRRYQMMDKATFQSRAGL